MTMIVVMVMTGVTQVYGDDNDGGGGGGGDTRLGLLKSGVHPSIIHLHGYNTTHRLPNHYNTRY